MSPSGQTKAARAPRPVQLAVALIGKVTSVDGWIGAACLGTLIVLMLAQISLRFAAKFIPGIPSGIPVAWEYSAYLMGACFTFGAAMTLRTGGHIRVNALVERLQANVVRWFELGASTIAFASVGFLTWSMIRFTYESFRSGQTSYSSGTLIWIPQAGVTIGLMLLTLQLFSRIMQAFWHMPLEEERAPLLQAE